MTAGHQSEEFEKAKDVKLFQKIISEEEKTIGGYTYLVPT